MENNKYINLTKTLFYMNLPILLIIQLFPKPEFPNPVDLFIDGVGDFDGISFLYCAGYLTIIIVEIMCVIAVVKYKMLLRQCAIQSVLLITAFLGLFNFLINKYIFTGNWLHIGY